MSYHVHTAIVVSFVYGSLPSLSLQAVKYSTLNFLKLLSHMNSHYSEGVFKPITSYQRIARRRVYTVFPQFKRLRLSR